MPTPTPRVAVSDVSGIVTVSGTAGVVWRVMLTDTERAGIVTVVSNVVLVVGFKSVMLLIVLRSEIDTAVSVTGNKGVGMVVFSGMVMTGGMWGGRAGRRALR